MYCIRKNEQNIDGRRTLKVNGDIEQFMVEGEVIEKSFELSGCTAYVSNKRLIVKKGPTITDYVLNKGSTVTDYDYDHISSISFKEQRFYVLIIPGIVSLAVGLFPLFYWDFLGLIGLIFIATGVSMFVMARFMKFQHLEMTVIGIVSPVKFMGERAELNSLLKVVRKKKQGNAMGRQ